jgi:hypothetical protein
MFGCCVCADASMLLFVCGADTVPKVLKEADAALGLPVQNGSVVVRGIIAY